MIISLVPLGRSSDLPSEIIPSELALNPDCYAKDVHITVRNGSCYRCLNCGDSLGCS